MGQLMKCGGGGCGSDDGGGGGGGREIAYHHEIRNTKLSFLTISELKLWPILFPNFWKLYK